MTPAREAGLRARRQQAGAERRLGRGPAGRGAEALLADDLGFDIGVTGFSIPEIDGLVEGLTPEEPGDPEDDWLPEAGPPRCRPGDVWQLGRHRLICGNALEPDGRAAADGRRAGADGLHRSALQRADRRPRRRLGPDQAPRVRDGLGRDVGERVHRLPAHQLPRTWPTPASTARSSTSAWTGATCRRCSTPPTASIAELKNLIVWVKDNGGMGTFYRSRHELIFAFKVGTAPHVNTFELGQHGRYRTNVWQYRGVNTLKAGRMAELELHPTVKPVQMIADAIRDVSGRGEIVLDLFGGSGSTLIAAEKTGRRAFLCELDPVYCDRIIRRWEACAKDEAEQLVCGYRRRRCLR